jgi:hypothetical protein
MRERECLFIRTSPQCGKLDSILYSVWQLAAVAVEGVEQLGGVRIVKPRAYVLGKASVVPCLTDC